MDKQLEKKLIQLDERNTRMQKELDSSNKDMAKLQKIVAAQAQTIRVLTSHISGIKHKLQSLSDNINTVSINSKRFK